jgi:rubrerythrin
MIKKKDPIASVGRLQVEQWQQTCRTALDKIERLKTEIKRLEATLQRQEVVFMCRRCEQYYTVTDCPVCGWSSAIG